MNNTTKIQVRAQLNAIQALAEAVRELGEVPSGDLYATVMGIVTIRQYESFIGVLVRAGVIKKRGHLLTWNKQFEVAAA